MKCVKSSEHRRLHSGSSPKGTLSLDNGVAFGALSRPSLTPAICIQGHSFATSFSGTMLPNTFIVLSLLSTNIFIHSPVSQQHCERQELWSSFYRLRF